MELHFLSHEFFKIEALRGPQNLFLKPRAPVEQVADDFYNFLIRAIEKVNSAQLKSKILIEKFIMGELPSLHDLVIAGKQAEFLLSLTVALTNKFIRAYEELMTLH